MAYESSQEIRFHYLDFILRNPFPLFISSCDSLGKFIKGNITYEMKFNSVKYSVISNLPNGIEDGQFSGYEYIKNEMRLYKLKMIMSYI